MIFVRLVLGEKGVETNPYNKVPEVFRREDIEDAGTKTKTLKVKVEKKKNFL